MERPLSDGDRANIAKTYDDRYVKFGRDIQTVGWGSSSDQELRFRNLLRGLSPKGKTILDFGCGLGDLVPYLEKSCQGDFKYIGIDLAENLITDCRKRWDNQNFRFLVGDIFDVTLDVKPDIIVQSGALTLKIEDNEGYARKVIQRLFDLASESVCLNFMSSYVDFQAPKNHHYSPETLFSFAKSLSRWVSLYHDYPLWEFTLQLHHEPVS